MDEPTDGAIRPGLRAGSRLGQYRLRRVLGSGGFGQVWEAEDTARDRVVALKLLRPEYSENEKFRQRLFREARAAGRLNEVHVVPIHDWGDIGGQLYIDMRLIDGTDLETVLAQGGPLVPPRAVAVVRQIAAALDAAHAVQMVHRDIKPANILLAQDDFACLLDFGLANAATDAKLTSTGFTIGTWAYMAPERFSHGEVDHRADIYSLACVLYECLTGSTPYAIGDLPALITAHLTAPIPGPSQQRPQIPPGFDDVIARGLAKNPQGRYASAGELARAAHRALSAPDRDDADTILADTQGAAHGDHAPELNLNNVFDGPPQVISKGAPPKAKRPAPEAKPPPPKPKSPAPELKRPAPVAKRPTPEVKRPASEAKSASPSRRAQIVVVAVGLAALVLAGLAIGWWVIQRNYYVAEYDGQVSIVRGIQGAPLGISLQQPYLVGCLNTRNELSLVSYGQSDGHSNCQLMTLQDLRRPGQVQVQTGLPGGSLDQAESQLRQLLAEYLLPICPPPRATYAPPAPAAPTTTSQTVTALPGPPPQPGIDCRTVA